MLNPLSEAIFCRFSLESVLLLNLFGSHCICCRSPIIFIAGSKQSSFSYNYAFVWFICFFALKITKFNTNEWKLSKNEALMKLQQISNYDLKYPGYWNHYLMHGLPFSFIGIYQLHHKCLYYGGLCTIEAKNEWILVTLRPNELSVMYTCPYSKVKKKRLKGIVTFKIVQLPSKMDIM